MSPEINGNPPTVTKRKKNRDNKKPSISKNNTTSLDFNMSNCNYFPNNPNGYHQSMPSDVSAYFSFLNYTNASEPMSLPIHSLNYPNYKYSNLNYMNKSFVPNTTSINGDVNEYLSLPVGNLDQNDDTSKRRYSDPGGLQNDTDDSTDDDNNSIIENKIIQKLSQQMNILKENNRKLSRELMEIRIELNMLKQQQNIRHHEREYEPGMLADIIREVRDAARVREDALLARVKHMIEEKQFNLNHLHLVNEKNRNSNDRILKLEEQMNNLSINYLRSNDGNGVGITGTTATTSAIIENEDCPVNSARQVIELEREALELRRELQETRAKKEEADQKVQQLDKKLSTILRQNDLITTYSSDLSEDGKTTSIDTLSVITTSSISHQTPRVTLSGPVTDL